ncbi:MAG TPA: DNA-processing protein DprA [Stellaceae bacterium]|jgi:DNA processing protein|nr:DNA-processing protein DprA [Stellaceae bacterium]
MPAARTLNPAERMDWLRLIRSENIGPITFYQLLQRFGSATAALEALPDLARRGGRSGQLRVPTRADALREMAANERIGAKLIAWGEPYYPAALAAIEDAPPLISARGNLDLAARRAIAVVGARNASANGKRFANDIALRLGQQDFVVVSGLARGIDAAAHQGALETGTIGALATGIDQVYPEENRALHQAIGERGLLLAEQPIGTEPHARNFPRRNRIISGIALGVLVVEAAFKSGSLITARLALEQGREVFAVPGSPLDPRCRGANDLIRRGAHLTESADDILAQISPDSHVAVREATAALNLSAADIGEGDLDRARALVLEQLSPTPVQVDDLVRATSMPAALVAAVLLEFALAGKLDRQAGNRVALL